MFEGELIVNQADRVMEQGAVAQRVVVAVRDRLAGLLRELDAGMVDVQAAPVLWDAFDEVEKLGAAGKLLIGQRVDESQIAKERGFKNTAEYMARRSGCSQRAAARQLQTSEKLAALPDTQTAVRRGAVSVDQAVTIADAASADPEAERGLLTMAGRVSLKELQDACLRVKAKADPDPERTRNRQHRDRFLRHGRRPDGTFSLYAQGPPEDEGLLQAALRHGIEDRFRTKTGGSNDDELDSYDQRAYDTLFDILRNHIAEGPFATSSDLKEEGLDGSIGDEDGRGGADASSYGGTGHGKGQAPGPEPGDTTGGLAGRSAGHQLPLAAIRPSGPDLLQGAAPAEPGPAPGKVCERCGRHKAEAHGEGRPPKSRRKQRRRPPNPAYLTLVRIDIEALNRGRQDGDEVCDMPGLGPISVPAARALLPESIIRLIVTRGEEVATVVHAGRGPNTAQKMALNWTQPICTVGGCNSQIVQADHRIDWALTRHTTLAELDHLCPHHHNLKTHKDWALVAGTGKRAFVPPGDPQHPRHDNQHSWSAAA